MSSVFSSPTDSRISRPPALQNACSSDYTALATDERAVHRGNVGLLDSHQNSESAPAPSVLIVGSGPAGLFAACELLRHGVKPRVVERRLAPHHEARGTALQPAVLEIIDRAGLIEPFLRASVHIRRIRLLGPGLRRSGTRAWLVSAARTSFSAACRNGGPRQSCATTWSALALRSNSAPM